MTTTTTPEPTDSTLPDDLDAALRAFQQEAWNGRDAADALDRVRAVVRAHVAPRRGPWLYVPHLAEEVGQYLPAVPYETPDALRRAIVSEFAALHRLNATATERARQAQARAEDAEQRAAQAETARQETEGVLADVTRWLDTYGRIAFGRTVLDRLQSLVGHQARELVDVDALRTRVAHAVAHAEETEKRAIHAEHRADALARDMRESVSLTPEAVGRIDLPASAVNKTPCRVDVPLGARVLLRCVQVGECSRVVLDIVGHVTRETRETRED